ncbi:hypothetical protein AAG570_009249 [Ranatra chinensis]|uniref:Borealin C-terminal domain-containing protein n=1 Tax=Ranatra chinensis TaxID=642074 RepID=A0ABD0YT66_9HEMI
MNRSPKKSPSRKGSASPSRRPALRKVSKSPVRRTLRDRSRSRGRNSSYFQEDLGANIVEPRTRVAPKSPRARKPLRSSPRITIPKLDIVLPPTQDSSLGYNELDFDMIAKQSSLLKRSPSIQREEVIRHSISRFDEVVSEAVINVRSSKYRVSQESDLKSEVEKEVKTLLTDNNVSFVGESPPREHGGCFGALIIMILLPVVIVSLQVLCSKECCLSESLNIVLELVMVPEPIDVTILINIAFILMEFEGKHGFSLYSAPLLLACTLQLTYLVDFLIFEKDYITSFTVQHEGVGIHSLVCIDGKRLLVGGMWGRLRNPNHLGALLQYWSWSVLAALCCFDIGSIKGTDDKVDKIDWTNNLTAWLPLGYALLAGLLFAHRMPRSSFNKKRKLRGKGGHSMTVNSLAFNEGGPAATSSPTGSNDEQSIIDYDFIQKFKEEAELKIKALNDHYEEYAISLDRAGCKLKIEIGWSEMTHISEVWSVSKSMDICNDNSESLRSAESSGVDRVVLNRGSNVSLPMLEPSSGNVCILRLRGRCLPPLAVVVSSNETVPNSLTNFDLTLAALNIKVSRLSLGTRNINKFPHPLILSTIFLPPVKISRTLHWRKPPLNPNDLKFLSARIGGPDGVLGRIFDYLAKGPEFDSLTGQSLLKTRLTSGPLGVWYVRQDSHSEIEDSLFKKPSGVTRKTRNSRTSSADRFRTPVNSHATRYGMRNIATVTPGPNINRPMSVLRRPVPGETAISLSGSPLLVSTESTANIAHVNVPLDSEKVISIFPRDGFSEDELPQLDEKTKSQLQKLQQYLQKMCKN